MGKIYRRTCESCGRYYEGRGRKYCSRSCATSPDFVVEEEILPVNIHVTPKKYTAARRESAFHSVHYGDIHFPFHDPDALSIRNQILDFLEPEIVVDHGDTGDCEAISKYPKNPFFRTSLAKEIQMMAKDLGEVHALTPEADHIWFEGNHEERLKRLIWKAAEDRPLGELLTLESVANSMAWGTLLGLDDLGWKIVPYPKHHLLFDKIILVHGNTVRKHAAYSARAEHERYGKSGISGHTHRMGAFFHTDYNGTHSWHELGMLGKVRDDYVAHANWQQGLGVVTWSEDKERWGFEHVGIYDGVAYFRGLRFEA